jgi:hypothetical protein
MDDELLADLHDVVDKIGQSLRTSSVDPQQRADLETLLRPVQAFLREYDPDATALTSIPSGRA